MTVVVNVLPLSLMMTEYISRVHCLRLWLMNKRLRLKLDIGGWKSWLWTSPTCLPHWLQQYFVAHSNTVTVLHNVSEPKRCTYRNKEYKPGAKVEINLGPDYARCDRCTCTKKGKFRKCTKLYYCEVGFLKCKVEDYEWLPGKCCPECKRKSKLPTVHSFLNPRFACVPWVLVCVQSLCRDARFSCYLFLSSVSALARFWIFSFINSQFYDFQFSVHDSPVVL